MGISFGALIHDLATSNQIDERRYQMLRRQLYTRVNPDTSHTWSKPNLVGTPTNPNGPAWYHAASSTATAPSPLPCSTPFTEVAPSPHRRRPHRTTPGTGPVGEDPSAQLSPAAEGAAVIAFDQFRQRRRA